MLLSQCPLSGALLPRPGWGVCLPWSLPLLAFSAADAGGRTWREGRRPALQRVAPLQLITQALISLGEAIVYR